MNDNSSPFGGMYDPEDADYGDGPVAPPQASGLPTAPVTPTSPVSPVSPAGPLTPAPVRAADPEPAPAPTAYQGLTVNQHPTPSVADRPVLPHAASTPGVSVVEDDLDERVYIDDLLARLVDRDGSDLYLSVGAAPTIRVHNEIEPVPGYGPMTPTSIQDTVYSILNERQRKQFEENLELDLAYTIPGRARFRVNVLRQRGAVGAVFRVIPWEILSLDQLGLPEIIGTFATLKQGLVLVTGPTGSGKSTTLASVVDRANRLRKGHIITIEDPIEFIHQHRGCIVNQREVGEDTHSFADALKHVLRQHPDIILVGELRDLESISAALTAAETGHLVLATLHTQSAQETISRIIDVFPPEQQHQVLTQLAATLQGVVCQSLARVADGNGLQAVTEIMIATPNIRALIRERKLQQVQSALQAGGKYGMQTLNQDLATHVLSGRITYDEAVMLCSDQDDLDALTGGPEGVAKALRARASEQQRQNPMNATGYVPPPSR